MSLELNDEQVEDLRRILGGWMGERRQATGEDRRSAERLIAILPPETPRSIVTDEMVEAYAAERWGDHTEPTDSDRRNLEAVERLGWLRDPNGIDWGQACHQAWSEIRRLRKRIHDLESAASNPSSSDEPWPTDEQIEVAAKAMRRRVGYDTPEESSRKYVFWTECARAALEAVAPPLNDDAYGRGLADGFAEGRKVRLAEHDARLEMAEGLLRRVLLSHPGVALLTSYTEAEYLRSLTGEGDGDE